MARSRLKSWVGWLALAVVVAASLAVGVARGHGARSTQERIDYLTQHLACPICNGETVYESQVGTSQAIRNDVARMVNEGSLTDDQILATIERSYPGSLLVPRSDGVDALIWALPAAAAVICVAGLFFVFRRWRRQIALYPDDDDRLLVSAALQAMASEDDPAAPATAIETGAEPGAQRASATRSEAGPEPEPAGHAGAE